MIAATRIPVKTTPPAKTTSSVIAATVLRGGPVLSVIKTWMNVCPIHVKMALLASTKPIALRVNAFPDTGVTCARRTLTNATAILASTETA